MQHSDQFTYLWFFLMCSHVSLIGEPAVISLRVGGHGDRSCAIHAPHYRWKHEFSICPSTYRVSDNTDSVGG